MIDVETVIIDSALPQFLVLEIVDRLGRRLAAEAPPGVTVPQLRMSRLGQDAALLGSAILPVNAHFFPNSDVLVGDKMPTPESKPRRRDLMGASAAQRKSKSGGGNV